MDLFDRLVMLIIGGCAGYVLARIVDYLREIKEEVDEIDEIVKIHKNDHDESGFSRLRTVVQDIVLLGVVLMVAYAAFASNRATNQLEENIEQDKRALCRAGEEQRTIDRNLVEAIFGLATGAIQRNRKDPPLTDEEVVRLNNYIDQVNSFRETTYDKIAPTDICKPFVDDDNVQPPPPPFPRVEN